MPKKADGDATHPFFTRVNPANGNVYLRQFEDFWGEIVLIDRVSDVELRIRKANVVPAVPKSETETPSEVDKSS